MISWRRVNMKIGHEYDRFRQEVGLVLKSKLEEFEVMGYGIVSEQELWNFLTQKKWRKPQEGIHLYQIVQDIFAVKVGEYMNYATVEAFKVTDFSFDNEDDLKELLK
jgi:hypothetical protein